MVGKVGCAVGLCVVFVLSAVSAAEEVREAWRSPSGVPRAVAVNPTDGSWWMAGATSLTLFAADDSVLAQVNGSFRPNAIAANPDDGSCWLAEEGRLSHYAADGDLLWTMSSFIAPISVSVNPADGSCWVADEDDGLVAHLAADGTELWRSGAFSAPRSVSANQSDGSCWVADTGNNQVVHLAADGTQLWRGNGFSSPYSVSANRSDDSCWVADLVNGQVVHLSEAGDELWRGPSPGPAHVAVNSADDSCWVADFPGNGIAHLAENGSELWSDSERFIWALTPLSVNPTDGSCWLVDGPRWEVLEVTSTHDEVAHDPWFYEPCAVSADPAANTCRIGDRGVYAPLGRGRPATVAQARADGTLNWLRHLGSEAHLSLSADSEDGTCWVGGFGSFWEEVRHLAADGSELWTSGFGQFAAPAGVSVNIADNSCWVADEILSRVVHLASSGTQVWSGDDFSAPSSVSANSADGSCWVADTGNDQVVHLDADGTPLRRRFGFSAPASVSVNAADGSCWVADTGNDQVVHLDAEGIELWRGGGFSDPSSVSVNTGDGTCWVADTGHDQVVHLDADGTQLWRGGGFEKPLAVSVSSGDGSCWVADTGNSQVVRLTLAPPVADFSGTPLTGDAPLTVSFTDLSTNGPTAWAWDFGDGDASAQQHPSHEYATAGTFTVSLTAANAGGSDTETKVGYIMVTFPDVASGHWACDEILACVDSDIVEGYPDGNYYPALSVKRDQMAVYIARALAGGKDDVPPGPAEATFDDVATGYWTYDEVEYCYAQSVVQGYTATTYEPTLEVTRDQMAVYVARALVAPLGETALDDYTPDDPRNFPDVDSGFWAYKHIEYCVEHGVVNGYDDGSYHPEVVVTRDQMAVYVARAFDLL